MLERLPLAPDGFPDMPSVAGVQISVAETALKYKGRPDLLMMSFDEGTRVAGVFTKSLCPSAPVDWCRQHLVEGEVRGLIVNAGNANAFTGQAGADACEAMVAAVADTLACRPSRVYAASTGVIGEVLPAADLAPFVTSMTPSADETAWQDAATAIMTTDTFAKGCARTATIGDTTVHINGIAKGSGMIAPDMATMLAFIVTDANLSNDVLQTVLSDAVERSFNRTTVDSDTSTSDTVLAFATGAADSPEIADADDSKLADFRDAVLQSARTWPCRSYATAKGHRSSFQFMSRAQKMTRQPSGSGCRLRTPPWSKRRLPAKMPTGVVSSWRLAKLGSGRSVTS